MERDIVVTAAGQPTSTSVREGLDPAWHQRMGDGLLGLGRWDEAVVAYERGIALDPEAAWCHNNRGHALARLARWEEAAASYRRAAEREQAVWTIFRDLGHALVRCRRWDEAIAAFGQAIELAGDQAALHHALGDALFEASRFLEAAQAYAEATRLQPDGAGSYANLGHAHGRLNRWPEAAAAYQRATELDPQNARLSNDLGNALAVLGHWEAAAEAYRRTADLDPGNSAPRRSLGRALLEHHRAEEAVAAFRDAIAASPGDAEAHRGLAQALFRMGRWAPAEREHLQAVSLGAGRAGSVVRPAIPTRLASDVAQIAPKSPTFTSFWRFLGNTRFTPSDEFLDRMRELERQDVRWISTLKQNNSKVWSLRGAISGSRCLTMGSLEGPLEKNLCDLGAARVRGIEGYRPNYLKCEVLRTVFPSMPVEFVEGDVSELPFTGEHDVVFCPGVLYHLPEPQRLLEKVRACDPALFFLTTQLAVDPSHPAFAFRQLGEATQLEWGGNTYRVRPFREVRKPGGYLTGLDYVRPSMWFYPADLERLLKDLGFRMEDAFVTDLGALGLCGAYVCSTSAAGSRASQFRVSVARRLTRWLFSRIVRRMSIEQKLRVTDLRG